MFGISTCMYHLALDNHLMCPFLGTITSSAPRFPQFPRGLCGVEVLWTFPHPLWHIQWRHDAYWKEEGPWCLWITLGGERWASEKKKTGHMEAIWYSFNDLQLKLLTACQGTMYWNIICWNSKLKVSDVILFVQQIQMWNVLGTDQVLRKR